MEPGETTGGKPWRLWPGVAIVGLQWLFRFVVPAIFPGMLAFGLFFGMGCVLLLVVWWAFFSRAPRLDRFGGALLLILGLIGAQSLLDPSLARAMMGLAYFVFAVPTLCLAFVAWAVLARRLPVTWRRVTMVVAILIGTAGWAGVRAYGFVAGSFDWEFAWRWAETPEERMLRAGEDEVLSPLPAADASDALAEPSDTAAEWPGFRGAGRDGKVYGTHVATDWSADPPVEMWRRAVGPAWSSFAVDGDLLYTQEQRGDEEVVSCYRIDTGEPVWRHADPNRFWDAMAGAGPRSTPSVRDGRVYALGPTGILNALDARSGEVIWSRDAAADAGMKVSMFGYSNSPAVSEELVFAAPGCRPVAYDRETGEHLWTAGETHGSECYSSPQLATVDGIDQIVMPDPEGVMGVALQNGAVLWRHVWKGFQSLQPAILPGGGVLIAGSDGMGGTGVRRVGVAEGLDGWTVAERWTTTALKPYVNDLVVHEGHVYGFDGETLTCIDLETGESRWAGGEYGLGQLVLLADQDLLLIQSETGDVALVQATPDGFTELGRIHVLDRKTWTHPALVRDVLLVRNDREMVALRLPLADG